MDTSTKNILLILLAVAFIVVLYLYVNKKYDLQTDCYNLPTDVNPAVFGPKYWAAFHNLAHKIPCSGCRDFAEKFMVFFHDVVNQKVGHPIYNRDNYNSMLLYLNTPKA